MPQRSKVDHLPEDIRQAINERLVANAFTDYRGLVEYLSGLGYTISLGSLNRYGQKFKERADMILFSAEQAKVLRSALDDESGAMNEVLLRVATEQVFTMLMEARTEEGDVKFTPTEMARILKGVHDIIKASGIQQQRAKRVREDMESRVEEKLNEFIDAKGIPAAVADALLTEFLGAVKKDDQ